MTSAWRGNNFKGQRWEAGRSDIWILQHELQKGEINILGTMSHCTAHKPFVDQNGGGRLCPHHGNRVNAKKAMCPAPGISSQASARRLCCLCKPLKGKHGTTEK